MSDSGFFRFPHTPHLAWLGQDAPRDDKVLSRKEADEFLACELTVEEKLDGANLGVSVDAAGELLFQNRGQYLRQPYPGQFARLSHWLASRADTLFDALHPDLLVFGEWCAARHSLDYGGLPDWWMVFDVYDRSAGRFWSAGRRDAWAAAHGLYTVPTLARGRFTLPGLVRMVDERPSGFRNGPLEGIVARANGVEWTAARAKLVRPDFVQTMGEHWRNRPLQWNRLAGQ
ncbi:DNA ligase [Xylophilus rhododendri]|uniref:DNA ligase n=1 Tax=Xylophilus rhododendri TaxID=2697032 RepID=A0A857JCK0_9BURK|nr:RNA ligase family protein [Xylophilus rhododendri]QHJ00406.1 DNA ligase [Xylophilus rhododendri]